MGKQTAKAIFNQLAEAYLVASSRSDAAQTFVKDLTRDHDYALKEYYFDQDKRRHSKEAMKNDTKGLTSRYGTR